MTATDQEIEEAIERVGKYVIHDWVRLPVDGYIQDIGKLLTALAAARKDTERVDKLESLEADEVLDLILDRDVPVRTAIDQLKEGER